MQRWWETIVNYHSKSLPKQCVQPEPLRPLLYLSDVADNMLHVGNCSVISLHTL